MVSEEETRGGTIRSARKATGGGEPALVAGGIKITLLSPIFGGFVFIAGRIVTFILTWLSQETNTDIVKDLK